MFEKNDQRLEPAILLLESGRIYRGFSFGAKEEKVGEVVFNTSMTGYQEILTDPSYKGQIIVMTEPHIGNVGANLEDVESNQVYCDGFVVREVSSLVSNWRATESLQKFLTQRKIPALCGIDTRSLTKHLRETGVMRAILSTVDFNVRALLNKVKHSAQMAGSDLVKEVSCAKAYQWESQSPALNIVVMDFGVKQNILRCLSNKGCRVTVVPAKTTTEQILSFNPDGIMLSNGPGDPAAVGYAINTIQKLIDLPNYAKRPMIPLFGICLGHQLLGLALGGKTFKLKFGHRGANHPVKDLSTGKIEITAQNHGFAVDIDSLAGKEIEITHVNLNDGTLEGMRHKKLPVFSVQYHPESSSGPHDSRYLFDRFISLIHKNKLKQKYFNA